MLKRTLIIATIVCAAQAGAALADNPFDDPYWKNSGATQSGSTVRNADRTVYEPSVTESTFAKYKLVYDNLP